MAVNNDFVTTREDVPLFRDASGGLLANDSPGLTIVDSDDTFATAEGGQIFIRSDGSYIYKPSAGFS